jgi:hypothetical protein
MNKITIIAENPKSPSAAYRAAWRDQESVGPTAGAALDALTDQMQTSEAGTLIVVQTLRPDAFFTASQRDRLAELLEKRRESSAAGLTLPVEDAGELEALVNQELSASAHRAAAIAGELGL